MKTATIRDVQHHLAKVLAWVEKGEEVEITRRNRRVARIVPVAVPEETAAVLPDFAGRARAIWGNEPKGKSLGETILEERGERL